MSERKLICNFRNLWISEIKFCFIKHYERLTITIKPEPIIFRFGIIKLIQSEHSIPRRRISQKTNTWIVKSLISELCNN